jgi:hypothetical protein
MQERKTILARLRRKIDIIRLDQKRVGSSAWRCSTFWIAWKGGKTNDCHNSRSLPRNGDIL